MKLSEITKDEFKQRLVDPRRAEVEKKLKEFDDVLRNQLGWRLDWSVWDLDSNVMDVIAYKPRTVPYPDTTLEDVRRILWTFILQPRWDEKHNIMINIDEESEDEITWHFYLLDD